VVYTRHCEPLADALKRVMASGFGEDCPAVADRRIDVRVSIAARAAKLPNF
jgi:hypothetical protein